MALYADEHLKNGLQVEEIVKRDGRRVPFHKDKIVNAIRKSFISVGDFQSEEYCTRIANDVMEEIYFRFNYAPTVEQIQDVVEEILIKNNHAQVAKAYILYRAERNRVREMNTRLMKIYEDITYSDAKDSDRKRENANVNGDTAMGTMLKYGQEGAKQFYHMFVLNPDHAKAHQDGDIHIHDLDFLTMTATCCQIDLIQLFKDGFFTGHGTLREPSDISSYSALTCIAIQSNQNDQHGGQSIPNFDYALAIGVRKTYKKRYAMNMARYFDAFTENGGVKTEVADETAIAITKTIEAAGATLSMQDNAAYSAAEVAEYEKLGIQADVVCKAQAFAVKHSYKETDKATYQAMEGLVHNLNTMNSRAGAQVPFSSINYGTDTTEEGRMIIRNVLLALESGLGEGETPLFPIHIFKVKEGINYNEDDVNYDLFKLACRVSAKRLFPNFSFIDAPYNLRYYKEGRPDTEIAYMGCRTRVIGNSYDPARETTYGRGNLSFTSVNLPRLAIKSKGDVSWFYRDLDKKLGLIIDQLYERYELLAHKKVKNFPFLMGQGIWLDSEKLGMEDEIGEVLKHGTMTVGFIGLAECLKAMTGKHHGESEESQKLGVEIIEFMRKRLDHESEKRGLNFTLIATPGEGLSGRFVTIDKGIYGEIPGVTDRGYYTNSFHVPVHYAISAADKIRLEAPYHALTNAGHITYVELDGDTVKNVDAFEKIIRYMKECGIGYGSINHPVDRDPSCGYTGIIGDSCPKCGRVEKEIKFERIRRITGYLVGSLERFNNAKRKEVMDRVKHC